VILAHVTQRFSSCATKLPRPSTLISIGKAGHDTALKSWFNDHSGHLKSGFNFPHQQLIVPFSYRQHVLNSEAVKQKFNFRTSKQESVMNALCPQTDLTGRIITGGDNVHSFIHRIIR
jgi:hypothetical protein